MSDQPTFRPRVMPMPKKNDWIIIHTSNGRSKKGLAYNIDEIDFMVDCGDKCYRRKIEAKTWNFADRTVEAQRLMEAAYRADTSELPEVISKLLERRPKFYYNASDLFSSILDASYCPLCCSCVVSDGKAADVFKKYAYHLLRWQAQQEQK